MQTSSDFRLEVLAQAYGDDAGRGELLQVVDGEMGKERKNGGQRGSGMADQSEANVVGKRPFAMPRNGSDDGWRDLAAREHAQDLRFVQKRIVERNAEDLRVAFGEERAGHARRAAPRQRDLLPQRKLRKTGQQLLFGQALQLGSDAGKKCYLREIHEEEIAQQTLADKARGVRMKGEGALDAITFQE